MSPLKLLFTLSLFGLLAADFSKISDVCQPIGPKFNLYGTTAPLDYNLALSYKEGLFVGKGGFGEVRKADFGFNNVAQVAIKNVRNEASILAEFDVLTKFSPMGVGPTFYGCQFDSSRVLIAQTLLYKDLSKTSTILRFKVRKNSELIARIRDAVDSLRVMWDNGYVHNDIKEHNIMTNPDFSRFYLIDFGLAQRKEEYMKAQGTPFYFSPAKWTSRFQKPQPRDDLYAIGLTVGILESVYGFDSLVTYTHTNGMMYTLPNSCFKSYLTSHCQQVLKMNVRTILTKANFGNYHRSPQLREVDTINFTTLIALMINYVDYPFNYDETVRILDRLTAEFEAIEMGAAAGTGTGAGAYVPKTKNSKFTDPEDEPDVFEFGRKYPRVHSSELRYFETLYQQEVTRDQEEDRLKQEIWELENEKKKILKEEEEKNKKKAAEEAAREAARKAAEEKAYFDKLEQEARDREALRKKEKEDREAKAKRNAEALGQYKKAVLAKQEEERKAEEKARQERLAKEQRKVERLGLNDPVITPEEMKVAQNAAKKVDDEIAEIMKQEAHRRMNKLGQKLDNNLRTSQAKLAAIQGQEPNTRTNSKMFQKKPDLFQAVQMKAEEGPTAMEEEIISPKQPPTLAPMMKPMETRDVLNAAKNLNLDALWGANNQPGALMKGLTAKIAQQQAANVNNAVQDALDENRFRFKINLNMNKDVKTPGPFLNFQRIVPHKPGAGNVHIIENRRQYHGADGYARYQYKDQNGNWVDGEEITDPKLLVKRNFLV